MGQSENDTGSQYRHLSTGCLLCAWRFPSISALGFRGIVAEPIRYVHFSSRSTHGLSSIPSPAFGAPRHFFPHPRRERNHGKLSSPLPGFAFAISQIVCPFQVVGCPQQKESSRPKSNPTNLSRSLRLFRSPCRGCKRCQVEVAALTVGVLQDRAVPRCCCPQNPSARQMRTRGNS